MKIKTEFLYSQVEHGVCIVSTCQYPEYQWTANGIGTTKKGRTCYIKEGYCIGTTEKRQPEKIILFRLHFYIALRGQGVKRIRFRGNPLHKILPVF
jgi:hypothetical protein